MKLSITAFALFALQGAAFAQSNSIGARGGAAGPVLPAHCRIDGMMDRRTDVHGKTYGIRFAIALPAHFRRTAESSSFITA